MNLLRHIILAAVVALTGGCTLPVIPFALIPAGYALWHDLTSDYSFQTILDVAWDDDGSLYVLHGNQDGKALFQWDPPRGVRFIRALPELGRGDSGYARLDVSKGRFLIATNGAILKAATPFAPLRWLPIAEGTAAWDGDQILVSAGTSRSCDGFRGLWKGDAAWSSHEVLYGQDRPWDAKLSPSRKRLAYSFQANPSDALNKIRVVGTGTDTVTLASPYVDRSFVWLSDTSLLCLSSVSFPQTAPVKAMSIPSGDVRDYPLDRIADPSFRVTAIKAAPNGSEVAWVVDRQEPGTQPYQSSKRDIRIVLADPEGQHPRQVLSLKDFPRGPRFTPGEPGIAIIPQATPSPAAGAR